MAHANAALTPRHRLRVARLVVEDGYPISEVAAGFQVSWPTVKRWVERYLAGEPMQDRSRYVGRRQGEKNRAATPDKPKSKWHNPKLGYDFVHTSSTTTPASPPQRSTTTRPPLPPPVFYIGPLTRPPIAASPSNACSQTMAVPMHQM